MKTRKGKNNPNYIDGRWNKKYYCLCGKSVSYTSAKNHNFKNYKCLSCSLKGKTKTKRHLKRIGLTLKKIWSNPKNHPSYIDESIYLKLVN